MWIHTRLSAKPGPFRSVPPSLLVEVLHDIAKRDLIERVPGGKLILGLAGERIVNGPSFYAEFQTQAELTVNYQGQTIGRSRSDLGIGGCLVLGGTKWAIEGIDHRRRVIEVRSSPTGNAQLFEGQTGEVHTEIYRHMRQMLMADRVGGRSSPPSSGNRQGDSSW